MIETCAITGLKVPAHQTRPLAALRPQIIERLRARKPDLKDDAQVSWEAINAARLDYVRDALAGELGELTHLDEEVLESLHKHELLSENPALDPGGGAPASFGQRLADRIAEFGGSWTFILSFGGILVIWIAFNAWWLGGRGFDPYPFILLNLVLSCLAALQAPVIMMSQNRQESRDRARAEGDYKINLKAELEIRHLHEKVDYLLHQHATRLLEIQQVQTELLKELASRR